MRNTLAMRACVVLATAAVVGHCLAGCGGPPAAARRSVEVATVVLLEADRETAERYAVAAAEALDASGSIAEYRERLAPWDALELALRVAQSAVLSASAVVEAWDAGGRDRWAAAAGCMVEALGRVREGLEALGLRVPPELASVIDLVVGVGAAACPDSGGA